MSERFESQKSKVKSHLLNGNSITPIDALNMFGAFRLAALIFELREEGHNIKTEMVYEEDKRYAKYSIIN